MRNITISDSTGGRYFWSDGEDDVIEMTLGEISDALECMIFDGVRFAVTYE